MNTTSLHANFFEHPVAIRSAIEDPADLHFIWNLRTSPRGMAASKCQEPITWEQHGRWFHAYVHTPGHAIYLMDLPSWSGLRIGVGRVHPASCGIRVGALSYILSESATNHGLGTWWVAQLCEKALALGYQATLAETQRMNRASIRVLEKNGFIPDPDQEQGPSEYVQYRKELG